MSTPQIKVTYFDATGRAEFTRLLLVAGGIAFEDERIAFADFLALKPTLPLGQVPVLTVDGVVYSQSMAMAGYAARLSGLIPTDALEALKADMVIATLDEVAESAAEIKFRTPDEAAKVEKTAKLLNETVPKCFGVIQNMIEGKFLLGDSMSWADVQTFNVVENTLLAYPDFKLASYPKIEALIAHVKANANVAAYLAKRQ